MPGIIDALADERHAVQHPHQGHAAASRPAAAGRGREARARRPRHVDRGLRPRAAAIGRARHPEHQGAAGDRGRGARGRARLRRLHDADPARTSPTRRAHLDEALRQAKAAGAHERALHGTAPEARRQGVVHAVARARAPRSRAEVPLDVLRHQHVRPQGLPPVARRADPAADQGAWARARARGSRDRRRAIRPPGRRGRALGCPTRSDCRPIPLRCSERPRGDPAARAGRRMRHVAEPATAPAARELR